MVIIMDLLGLFFTLILGLFIVFGAFIMQLFKNKDKFLLISLSMAFGVMISLIIFELVPESYSILRESHSTLYSALSIFLLAGLGFLVLKILDHFIPDHEGEDEKKLMHIGIVSSIALTIHNIIEGMAVYGTINSSINAGLMLSIGVGLHNIPLGMAISSAFYKSTQNKTKSNILILFISLSTFIGGLIMHFTNITDVESMNIVPIVLSITVGMLIYINLMEILPRMLEKENKKTALISAAAGVIVLFISTLLG